MWLFWKNHEQRKKPRLAGLLFAAHSLGRLTVLLSDYLSPAVALTAIFHRLTLTVTLSAKSIPDSIMVKLTAASISNHYCSDSDSDDESSVSLKSFQFDDESSSSSDEEVEEQDDDLMKKYTYNQNNVLVPNESKHTFQTEDPSSSYFEQDDNDDSSNSSESSASIDLDMETPMVPQRSPGTQSTSNDSASWKFDLKAMEKNNQGKDQDPDVIRDEMKSFDEILSKQCSADDEISFVSTEERAQMKKDAAAQREQALAQKHAERKARSMEQVKKRLAKKNAAKQAEKPKEETKTESKLDMSDDARRQRVHQWYMRCGMVSKKELRKRIIKQKLTGIAPDDVELLPWNFNDTMVNASKMLRYQLQ